MASKRQVEIVAIVSSDPYTRLGSGELMSSAVARSVQRYRSGAEVLRMVDLDPRFAGAVVVVDNRVDDIAPLNLVDALRSSAHDLDVIVALDGDSPELVKRAMLAGARAAVRRECSDADLELAIQRVIAARPSRTSGRLDGAGLHASRGAVISFVGARGGAGRSTLASLVAALAARGGVDTGLLDFDIQFGDLSLLFGAASDTSLYSVVGQIDSGGVPEGFGRTLLENMTLYTPTPAPEKAELLSGKVHAAISALAGRHQMLVVSTGAFWTLLHSELLESSDQIVCVLDQTVPGVRATVTLSEHFDRLGLASARRLYVVNRVRPTGVNPKEISRALGIDRVWPVPDGGQDVALALDAGGVDLVADMKTSVIPAIASVLDEIAMRSAVPLRSADTMRKDMRRPHSWRRPSCRR